MYSQYVGASVRPRTKRAANRENSGYYSYFDQYGERHFGDEALGPSLTVSAAWSCLRKSWKGYKIASGNTDDDGRIFYARRIIHMCKLLRLEEPEFKELLFLQSSENEEDTGETQSEYEYENSENLEGSPSVTEYGSEGSY